MLLTNNIDPSSSEFRLLSLLPPSFQSTKCVLVKHRKGFIFGVNLAMNYHLFPNFRMSWIGKIQIFIELHAPNLQMSRNSKKSLLRTMWRLFVRCKYSLSLFSFLLAHYFLSIRNITDKIFVSCEIANPSPILFLLRLSLVKKDHNNNNQFIDQEVLPFVWSDNYITLFEGERGSLVGEGKKVEGEFEVVWNAWNTPWQKAKMN